MGSSMNGEEKSGNLRRWRSKSGPDHLSPAPYIYLLFFSIYIAQWVDGVSCLCQRLYANKAFIGKTDTSPENKGLNIQSEPRRPLSLALIFTGDAVLNTSNL